MPQKRLTDRIDRAIDWLKWPVAIAAAVLLPGVCRAFYELVRTIIAAPHAMGPFTAGLAVYLLAWWTLLRRPIAGSYFATLEHEVTHALFATVTGHRVVGLKATWKGGGRITFAGRGNWLITISPYFFPTACVVVLLVGVLVPVRFRLWTDALLGAAVGYHVISTWRETHLGQTDLKKVGYFFSALFLPTANLLALGVILSFAHGGAESVEGFLRHIRVVF